ncbi:histidinol-phosphate transaminase [Flagellimonas sp. DF-77]|uniref:histidinol-phosphate transaminase n=1 Tax=Flagellimonas algarum TaxID=3230298 RepID=UPI003392CB3C
MKAFDINTWVRPSVQGLQPYSSARDEFKGADTEMVFLDANENPFENGVNRYPDPQQRDLKRYLAEQRGLRSGQLLLGNGSDEVLDLIFRAFCEPNVDNIITLPPTYGMYKVLSGINAIANREVLLNERFEPDVKAILNRVDPNTKILFLCSPNNPTGNVFNRDTVAELLQKFQGLVVIDEAYIDFTQQPSWTMELDNYPNLIVTQTLSKAYGMAGIRLGICIASKAIIEVLNKIKPPYNVNALTQSKALQGLRSQRRSSEVLHILEEREQLAKALETVRFVKKTFPTEANFILARVDDADRRYDELLKLGIVVRNRSSHARCENTLRFTIGTKEENKLLLEALKQLDNG